MLYPETKPLVDVGDVIEGRYRVDQVLGQGAMGVVVAATHLELLQSRAIKFMLPEVMADRESVERFLREARAAARLQSRHAVKVHDVARLPTGEPYIVMEHLEGLDLKRHLHQRRVLPVVEAAFYIAQACDAIGEAHNAGIIHRDLKPANIFLACYSGGDPCVKVLDFGIAKLNDAQVKASDGSLTSSHMVIGSPPFMSPEQIISTRDVDARTDIWSLGVILYSMVTGRLPFRGPNPQIVFAAVQRDEPPRPSELNPELPPEFEKVILRCLEKEPARRYASASDLAAALLPWSGIEPAPPPPASVRANMGGDRWRQGSGRPGSGRLPSNVNASNAASSDKRAEPQVPEPKPSEPKAAAPSAPEPKVPEPKPSEPKAAALRVAEPAAAAPQPSEPLLEEREAIEPEAPKPALMPSDSSALTQKFPHGAAASAETPAPASAPVSRPESASQPGDDPSPMLGRVSALEPKVKPYRLEDQPVATSGRKRALVLLAAGGGIGLVLGLVAFFVSRSTPLPAESPDKAQAVEATPGSGAPEPPSGEPSGSSTSVAAAANGAPSGGAAEGPSAPAASSSARPATAKSTLTSSAALPRPSASASASASKAAGHPARAQPRAGHAAGPAATSKPSTPAPSARPGGKR